MTRGTAWAIAACLLAAVQAPVAPAAAGKFGGALAVGEEYAAAERNPIYFVVPMTVECWAKIGSSGGARKAKSAPTILIANEPRHSVTHWQLYARKDTGALAASMPGWEVKELASQRDIVDGQWHHLAMVFDGKTLRLYLDGAEVAKADMKKVAPYPDTGPLTFGHFPGVETNRDVLLDEVRISRVVRATDKVSDAPFTPDADTVGLWHFDDPGETFADASLTRNAARLVPVRSDPPPGGGFDGTLGARTRWADMDFGPFFSSTLLIPSQKQNVTHKAISLRLGPKHAAAFDTELLRVSAVWAGEFLSIKPFREGLGGPPDVGGQITWSTAPAPGWAVGHELNLADPRASPHGPMPRTFGRYKGLYVHGRRIILAYSVGATDVLEMPAVETAELRPLARGAGAIANEKVSIGRPEVPELPVVETAQSGPAGPNASPTSPTTRDFFTRTLEVGPHETPLAVVLCDLPGATPKRVGDAGRGEGVQFTRGDTEQMFSVRGAPEDVEWKVVDGARLLLRLPPTPVPTRFKLVYSARAQNEPLRLARFEPPEDLSALTRTIPPRKPEPVMTRGVLGAGDGPYVVDTLTAPVDNPWKSFLRFGGLDFFSSGDAAVCSVSGDVWVVSGIDDKLEQLKWRRFATGLFQPLGLKVLDDKVYALGRDQITRLHDLNGDGEADFYENFNNDCKVTTNGHAYATNLETDPQGNFYYTRCADNTEHGGTLLRVSKDGSRLDVFATGLRNPNGMGVSPAGVVTAADNQGEWVPASRLDVVEPGEFLGYQPMSKRNPPPTDPGRPLCWMPQNVDNSSGGQVWVMDGRWGPFKDYMLHTSYGAAALLLVLEETVDGQHQGGVVRFPLTFDTGIMRGRFRRQDGQLYLCGLRGWQTAGVKDGALHRVRYTGKPVHMPAGLNAHRNGLKLTFTCALDSEVANDPDSYSILRWNYRWSSEYGSRQWSLTDPSKQGYDTLKVKSAKLLSDGKSVFLEVEDMRPVMQMQISYDLEASDGTQVRGEIYNTIHALVPE